MLSTDIKFYLTGGAGNTDPNLSLGGTTSTTEVSGSLHGLFDYVSPEEGAAGDTEYRAITVKNTHATETLYAAVAYIGAETTSSSTTVAIAYDSGGTQSVANESTAPSSPALTFSTPTTKATGIALGDMAPGATKRIWLKRIVTAGAAKLANDTGSLTIEGGVAA